MKKNQKSQRAITLVALVLTIIVLLILLGISIQAITNQGIFEQAQNAKRESEIANIKEKIALDIYEKQLTPPLGTITDAELEDILDNYGTVNKGEDGTIIGITTEKRYEILLSDIYSGGTTKEDAKTLLADGSWNSSKNVNSPKFLQETTNKDASGTERSTTYPTVTNNAMIDYVVHPCFTDGSKTAEEIANGVIPFGNGEWDAEIPGFWVAKYPAIAYLTQSSCGRNGTEVNLNNYYTSETSSWRTAITGIYADATSGDKTTTLENAYNTTIGVKGSSTANITGVYDLNGCVWERTSAYISNGNSNLSTYGSSYVSTVANINGYKTLSTRYATVYPYNSSSDSHANNYNKYKGLKSSTYGYGDAILETSTEGENYTSWNGDYSGFPFDYDMFFIRKGDYAFASGSGVFMFASNFGASWNNIGFRAILVGV